MSSIIRKKKLQKRTVFIEMGLQCFDWSLVFLDKAASSSDVFKDFLFGDLILSDSLSPMSPTSLSPPATSVTSLSTSVHKSKTLWDHLGSASTPFSLFSTDVVLASSHFHPDPSEVLFASVLMEAHPAVRKEGRRTEGRGERNEQKRRGGGGGISSWFRSAVVSIRQLRCCETRCWGGVWTKKGGGGGGGLKSNPARLWLPVWGRIRRTSGAQQENGFL